MPIRPDLTPPVQRRDAFRPAQPLTTGPRHHFFGYYEHPPWDAAQRRILGHAADWHGRLPAPDEVAEVGVIEDGRWRALATTRAWNWQQGSQLRWLPDGRVLHNDRHDDRIVAVIHDLDGGSHTLLPRGLCAVSPDGRTGVGLDFGRLARCRPVVGVAASAQSLASAPDDDGLWLVDVASGQERLLLALAAAVALAEGPDFAHAAAGATYAGRPGFEQPGAGGHRFEHNRFDNNLTTVAISGKGAGEANVWRHNRWDEYEGFDRDHDGIGDTPHEVWLYADRIWMETPLAAFFRNSPVLELIDFLERLAPFSAPYRILSDPVPDMQTVVEAVIRAFAKTYQFEIVEEELQT